MPVCRQVEGQGGALHGSGSLGENSADESPCHPTPIPACPAGAEERGNMTAKKLKEVVEDIEISPEWRSAITSTPRVEIEKIDLTVSPRGRAQAPTVTAVEVIDPEEAREIVRRLRKRGRMMEKTESCMASDNSFETQETRRKNVEKKKKSEARSNSEDRKTIELLREEIRMLKEKNER